MEKMNRLTLNGVCYAVEDTTKLPLPDSGAVGQLLTVAAVDETGKVTAVTAAEDPTAGVAAALEGILAIQAALIGGEGT